MDIGILLEKEKEVRECILESFQENRVSLKDYEKLPPLPDALMEACKIVMLSSSSLEREELFFYFKETKNINSEIITILLSGNSFLLENSTTETSIDLRITKGIGIDKMIRNLALELTVNGSICVDYIETVAFLIYPDTPQCVIY